ncbi:MAG: hypothetical protein ACYSN7_01060, partial [Planctomycetota bacterium]
MKHSRLPKMQQRMRKKHSEICRSSFATVTQWCNICIMAAPFARDGAAVFLSNGRCSMAIGIRHNSLHFKAFLFLGVIAGMLC